MQIESSARGKKFEVKTIRLRNRNWIARSWCESARVVSKRKRARE